MRAYYAALSLFQALRRAPGTRGRKAGRDERGGKGAGARWWVAAPSREREGNKGVVRWMPTNRVIFPASVGEYQRCRWALPRGVKNDKRSPIHLAQCNSVERQPFVRRLLPSAYHRRLTESTTYSPAVRTILFKPAKRLPGTTLRRMFFKCPTYPK